MPSSWKQILRTNFRRLDELSDYLQLQGTDREALIRRKRFPLNLPRRLAEKIQKGTLRDPILRQFVPLKEEEQEAPHFLFDPVGDGPARCGPHSVKKYEGRALCLPTGACAMHCRFCFRQHFDYDTSEIQLAKFKEDNSLSEAILSGGDPLSLSDEALCTLIERLAAIPHLRRLRFHSRFPIGIPERITPQLKACLRAARLQVYFVIHTNHPRELDEEVLSALQQLPATLLSQSVLLRGVNDDKETLNSLFEKLIDHGIVPYYLHQLDRVQGAAHFEVPVQRGLQLIEELKAHLPGYAVPRYVQDIPNALSKTALHPVDSFQAENR